MRRAISLLFASLAAACAAEPVSDQPVEGDDPWKGSAREAVSAAGRWSLSASAREVSDRISVRYDGAPAWSGTSGCSGTFTDGARVLGDHLVETFGGATSYDGYSCRQNTANRSQTSMHGTGRAIDVFVPLDGADADNGLGDPVANWLVENADAIGVQLIIWDRTIWNPSRSDKDREYGGPHPHHDHLHVELNEDGASGAAPWFESGAMPPPTDPPPGSEDPPADGGSDPADPSGPAPGATSSAVCADTCPYAHDGECDDGGEGAVYDLCDLGTDCADCGVREEHSW